MSSVCSEIGAKFFSARGVVAAVGPGAGAFAEHPVEAVGEEVERFVGVVGADAGDEIGAADLDVAFGGKLVADAAGVIVLEVDTHAHQVIIVPEQALGDAEGVVAQGRGDLEVNPSDDHFFNELGGAVRIESMDLSYWKARFNGARRIETSENPAANR